MPVRSAASDAAQLARVRVADAARRRVPPVQRSRAASGREPHRGSQQELPAVCSAQLQRQRQQRRMQLQLRMRLRMVAASRQTQADARGHSVVVLAKF